MPLADRDLSYLVDIFDCVEDVVAYTSGISIFDFERDKMRRLAVERQLEVIGQAANRVTKDGQGQLSQIPWSQMIGLRNKLAHDYGDILAKRIWDIARSSIPELRTALLTIPQILEYSKAKKASNI